MLEIFYPYPLPGTALRDECVALGLLGADDYPKASYSRPAFPTRHRPSKIVRTLRARRSPRELGNYVRVGLSQLRQLMSG